MSVTPTLRISQVRATVTPAWIDADGAWTHDELRRLVAQQEVAPSASVDVFTADASRATVLRMLTCLDAGRTFLPLHPRLSAREREALRAQAAAYQGRPAVLLATSGTAGVPKLAIVSHEALTHAAMASNENLRFEAQDRWLACMPLAHAGGLSILTRSLIAGASVVAIPSFSADAVIQALRQHAPTGVSLVPAMLSVLLDHPRADTLRSLRFILVGGSPFPTRLKRRSHERGLSVLATYGLTEMASQVTTQRPGDPVDPNSVDSGFALAGAEIETRVDGRRARAEERGRIFVRGPMRMDGYVGGSALTPEDWIDTKDVGSLDEAGRLTVLGRSDDVIVTGGENVDPLEIEGVLAEDGRVVDCLVCGVPDERYGQLVAALFVLAPEHSAEAVLERAQTKLASFKRPRLHLVVDAIPRTRLGKPDRRAAFAIFLASRS